MQVKIKDHLEAGAEGLLALTDLLGNLKKSLHIRISLDLRDERCSVAGYDIALSGLLSEASFESGPASLRRDSTSSRAMYDFTG